MSATCKVRVWGSGDQEDCGRFMPCSLHTPKTPIVHARRFQLYRDIDETGVSGTGLVAEGIEFTSGMVAMTWHSVHRCVNVYESIKTVEQLHGHGGKTRVVWVDV